MKRLVLLGSTGSIGKKVLSVVRDYPEKFKVIGLASGRYSSNLSRQIVEFKPRFVSVSQGEIPEGFSGVDFLRGIEGLKILSSLPDADIVVISVVGAVGIYPLVEAIKSRKQIALANKESLVIGGEYIRKLIKSQKSKNSAFIIPVDSEHSAIFQCLEARRQEFVNRILITASGGALYRRKVKTVTPSVALKHPTWQMGKKITIDSATLMNKGLEVIEAHYLFNMPYEKIEVLIHPQSVVHSLVEFIDGSVLAQLSPTDMHHAVQYALTYPDRYPVKAKYLRLEEVKKLEFETPDFSRFPCFKLAVESGKEGGIMPAVMNAANEVAVAAFLENKIRFEKIPEIIEKTIKRTKNKQNPSLEEIIEADMKSREVALSIIKEVQ